MFKENKQQVFYLTLMWFCFAHVQLADDDTDAFFATSSYRMNQLKIIHPEVFGLVWFLCLMAYQLFLGYLMPKPFS